MYMHTGCRDLTRIIDKLKWCRIVELPLLSEEDLTWSVGATGDVALTLRGSGDEARKK
jgi:hypothetical protein